MGFRGYDAEQIEHQFNPRVTVPDHGDYRARRARAAADARRRLSAVYDVVPPFVSQRMIRSAPASTARWSVCKA